MLDIAVSIAGYLMFGIRVHDEVTSNIFLTKGYPTAINFIIIIFISIIPITKIPLNARPIIVVTEAICGIGPSSPSSGHTESYTPQQSSSSPPHVPDPNFEHSTKPSRITSFLTKHTPTLLRALTRIAVLAVITILAIVVPGFDTVMALLGSAMAFSICLILPLAFNLKIFTDTLPRWERALNWVLIVVCSVMAVIGTVWVFLPRKVRERWDGL